MWYNKQTDNRWKDKVYDNGCSIGHYGCLITALANIFQNYPDDLAEKLAKYNCFNGHGYLNQDMAQTVCGYTRKKVSINEIDEDKPYILYYNWKLRDGSVTQHFSNIIRVLPENYVMIFNVYNGKNEMVHLSDIISIIEIIR